MEWKERLWGFNAIYGFYENPQIFNFEFNPERLIVRNLALRTANRQLYKDFLYDNYPFHLRAELKKFDRVANNLLKLTAADAARFFESNEVNVVCSDLDYREESAIYTALSVEEGELKSFMRNVDKNLVENYVLPEQLVNRTFLWIDGSALSNFAV
ncbi:hypothetical protein [Sphingobacterium deserti]|uniref:Uncharacterized protein n=1 Tax=Sphingobacterium deserti TaxID=1229276 RepID=A0A0B8SZE2_9SPHI|nr:hypothetical protein [Sphingobacterium deserti]KGE12851.1 hypothetical protein DI53_3288 [Sphingobacterium deserti]